MSRIDQWKADGQVVVTNGVSSHLDPDVLPEGAIAWAKNVATSSGKPSSRWRFRELGLLPGGILNGAGFFSKAGGLLVGSTNGEIWTVDFNSGRFRLRHYSDTRRNTVDRRAYFTETAESMVIQNESGAPWIFSGNRLRRATEEEVPRGGPMAYGNGRLWVARGDNVLAGDIVQNNVFQSELKFTEVNFWAGGGGYRMPGKITGMQLIPQSDSSTGFGSLLVFGKDWTVSLRAEVLDRTQWQSTAGFVSTVFPHIGCISHESITTVNQDVYWRSGDGELRSFRQAVLDYQTPGATPLSSNLKRLFGHESETVASRSSTAYFQNRLLGTTSGYRNRDVVLFRDLYTMDFVPQATMGEKGRPMFDGEWDGHQFVQLITGTFAGRERCLAIIMTEDREYRLVEILDESGYDEYLSDPVAPEVATAVPTSEIEFRRFDFQDRFELKKAMATDIYLSDLSRDTYVKVYVRPDDHPGWILWDDFDIRVAAPGSNDEPAETLKDENGNVIRDENDRIIYAYADSNLPGTVVPRYRVRLRTRSMEEVLNADTLQTTQHGYTFQIKLEITSPSWALDRLQVFALPVQDTPFAMHNDVVFDTEAGIDSYGEITEYRVPTGQITEFLVGSDGEPYENDRGIKYQT